MSLDPKRTPPSPPPLAPALEPARVRACRDLQAIAFANARMGSNPVRILSSAAVAEVIADRVVAAQGGVTGPRLTAAMIAAGYGEMIATLDKRWPGWFLNPQRGWRSIGRVP